MNFEDSKILALNFIEKSNQSLKSAEILYKENDFIGANNRAYYSVFYAINAVLSLDGKSYKKHKNAIANFNKTYINSEKIFDKNIGRKLSNMQKVRERGDYDYTYNIPPSISETQIENAKYIVKEITEYINNYVENNEKK